MFFGGEGAVVFVVVKTVRVGADQFAAVADVIDAVAVDVGIGSNALVGPVVDGPAGEFVVGSLPEQLAGLLVEAEQDALVAF